MIVTAPNEPHAPSPLPETGKSVREASRVRVESPYGKKLRRDISTLAAAGLLLTGASGFARANENDVIYKAIEGFCLTSHKSVDAAAQLALKAPFEPRDSGRDKGPPYAREVWMKLAGSTIVTFSGPSRSKPPNECLFVSYSDDVVELVGRLRTAFGLPEPTKNSVSHNQFEIYGWTTLRSRPIIIEISYGTQDNARSGGFSVNVRDGSTDDTERLVKAIRQLCLTPRRTADEAAKAALRTPYALKDEGLRKSAGHERLIRLTFASGIISSFATFKAASPNGRLDECEISASITDMPRLMTRLRETFGFSAPTPGAQLPDTQAISWRSSAKIAVGSETRTADLTYLLNSNMHTGTFTLTVTR